ncbi:MAG: hypothetical protein O2826_05415 [Chloroflexi bacterium]|nr:hypothetical protein [Chloroflexota bacterium]MDA1173944.1 hypothetical protein [Chloroflexota bacterium]
MPAESHHQQQIKLYEMLVASLPGVQRKGAANPYTSLNGNMFTFLGKDGSIGIRLASTDRARFIAEHSANLAVQYGAVMKEYVAVPEALQGNIPELTRYFALSLAYAETLKPKPTTRNKPTA